MTPSARVAAAIEILDALDKTQQPADRLLRDYFRARRYAGSKDRAAIAERVFAVLRHRASLGFRMKSEAPRALVIASLAKEGLDEAAIAALFSGAGYGPAPLESAERAALAQPPREEPPLSARGEYPAFLEEELTRAFGAELSAEMEAMQARAPVDLRANPLKASRDAVLATLRAEGFDAQPMRFAPHGIRLPPGEGSAALSRLAAFENGEFEFQDEAAQIASLLVGARPGERILDLAAGAGGKSLALAADMENKGEILACDIREAALKELRARAERAGATIIRTALARDIPRGAVFDAVLVDAPCSGSGTWRRQPELRWRLMPERLAELTALQDTLLDQATSHVRPGGRIVYATCSILPSENEDRVDDFLARHREFTIDAARERWRLLAKAAPSLPGSQSFYRSSPHTGDTDGFFAAILLKSES